MYNSSKRSKAGFSIIKTLLLIIIGFFIWNKFSDKVIYKNSPKYIVQLKKAIQKFAKQKDTVKSAYNEAIEAQNQAKEINYVFKNEKTKDFIKKWKIVEKEATELRKKYEVYKNKTENFIDGLDDKLSEIKNDATLKKKMKEYSKEKAKVMAQNILKIDSNIDSLETSIQKGNNLIIALETVSSFNELAQDVNDFDVLLKGSGKIFSDIDSLISEGMTVLDQELQ